MRALLASRGLDPRLADLCRPAAALIEDPQGRSRIGGLPRLARDVDWPTGVYGHLPHLASIALDDLPEFARPGLDGELAIFLVDGTTYPLEPGLHFAFVHTPANQLGDFTAAPPVQEESIDPTGNHASFHLWTEIRLAARPMVAVPWEPGMGVPHWVEEHVTDEEYEGLDQLIDELEQHDPAGGESGHLVFGADSLIREESPEDPPLLIQLDSQRTYWEHGDGAWILGDVWHLAIRGDVDAFRRGDFSGVTLDAWL